jgi:hypothetical protein
VRVRGRSGGIRYCACTCVLVVVQHPVKVSNRSCKPHGSTHVSFGLRPSRLVGDRLEVERARVLRAPFGIRRPASNGCWSVRKGCARRRIEGSRRRSLGDGVARAECRILLWRERRRHWREERVRAQGSRRQFALESQSYRPRRVFVRRRRGKSRRNGQSHFRGHNCG